MKKIKEYKGIIIIGLIILGFAFYWFQLRPINIKKNCYSESTENAIIKNKIERSATFLFDREHWKQENGPEPAYIQEHLSLISNDNYYVIADFDMYYKRCLIQEGY